MGATAQPKTFRVHAPILLDDLDGPSGDGMSRIRIPTIRKAEFVAGRYGALKFDDAFLQAIIRNFESNVLGVEVSIDASHRPELGALGWAERLTFDGLQMTAEALATPDGAKLVREKTYRYASAEIDPNYVDRETGEEYGPTLIGIALTNRPYVHRQGEVTLLSLDDTYRVMESGQEDVVEGDVLKLGWSDAARKAAGKARELNRIQTSKLTAAVRKAIQNARTDTTHFQGRLSAGRSAFLKVLGRTGIRRKEAPKTISAGSHRLTPTTKVASAAIRAVGKARSRVGSRPKAIRKALKRQFEPIKGR